MRILLLLNSFGTGGAEYSTLRFFGYLRSAGLSICVCTLKKEATEFDVSAFGIDAADVVRLPEGGWRARVAAFRRLLKQFNPDLVHSVLFEANLVARLARISGARFYHVESLVNETYNPIRLHESGITWWKLHTYRFLDMVTARLGTDHFHANGHTVARHYNETVHIPVSKMTVIPRGRAENRHDKTSCRLRLLREQGLPENSFLFLNVGRHEYQKGQDILLHAFAALRGRLPQARLLIAGREGKSTAGLRALVHKLGLQDVVHLLGHRDDVPQLLAASDVFVFPSRYEGLPGGLIEAEAAALPIVCTRLPMMLEVIEEGVNALTFSQENTTELADAMLRLASDTALRETMSAKSLEIFNRRFRVEEVHAQMLQFYYTLVGALPRLSLPPVKTLLRPSLKVTGSMQK